jgi:DNA topoisomerase VI subunit A
VVGRLTFREDGDLIDCRRMGVGGKAIPPNIDKVTELRSDALFVLLVEKDAAFMRLAEDRFYNTFPCIIITAKGQPDVATRLFLKKLKHALRIPVLALVDSDPYGLKILAVYMKGAPRAPRAARRAWAWARSGAAPGLWGDGKAAGWPPPPLAPPRAHTMRQTASTSAPFGP